MKVQDVSEIALSYPRHWPDRKQIQSRGMMTPLQPHLHTHSLIDAATPSAQQIASRWLSSGNVISCSGLNMVKCFYGAAMSDGLLGEAASTHIQMPISTSLLLS